MDIPKSNSKIRYGYNRKRLKQRCRDILAEHIKQKTGLDIPPGRVRLRKTEKDGYCWLHKPEAKHLFSANLSKQTLAACEKICSGVGVDFEAVAAPRACFQTSLENPVIIQSAPQFPVSKESSEVESIGPQETYDMSTELIHQLLLSAQQSLVAESTERERVECELKLLQSQHEQLFLKHSQTTEIMYKSLHAFDAIVAFLGDLREEIHSSIE